MIKKLFKMKNFSAVVARFEFRTLALQNVDNTRGITLRQVAIEQLHLGR